MGAKDYVGKQITIRFDSGRWHTQADRLPDRLKTALLAGRRRRKR